MSRPTFRAVVLDVDSTVAGIEGIDWLARRRGADIAARVGKLTELAMSGAIPLDSVYAERLAMIRPSAREMEDLARAYLAGVAPGAVTALVRLADVGVRVVFVSGGLREAILPLACHLGVAEADVHAVSVRFDAAGLFDHYDVQSPLATTQGKPVVVRSLRLPRPVLGVGDGATDLAMRPAVDAFAAYTGFTRRELVVREADYELRSFDELTHLVIP
ncbi:MAG: phosphoserine phosphatase SerB [Gemmatimonadaceae bacterium]